MKTIFLAGNLGMLFMYVSFMALFLSLVIIVMLYALRKKIKRWWHLTALVVLALLIPLGIFKCLVSFFGIV